MSTLELTLCNTNTKFIDIWHVQSRIVMMQDLQVYLTIKEVMVGTVAQVAHMIKVMKMGLIAH